MEVTFAVNGCPGASFLLLQEKYFVGKTKGQTRFFPAVCRTDPKPQNSSTALSAALDLTHKAAIHVVMQFSKGRGFASSIARYKMSILSCAGTERVLTFTTRPKSRTICPLQDVY